MTYQSMIETAYTIMSKRKRAIEFPKLFQEVCQEMKFDADKAKSKKAEFYSDLMLDSRFASLKDNKWDLKERHSFNETHVNIDEIIVDEDDDSDSEVDEEELESGKELSDDE